MDTPIPPDELDQLWHFGDPAGSEARFRERLASLPPGSLPAMEVGTQLARAIGLQGRFDEANSLLDSLVGEHPLGHIRIALERGRLRNSAGAPETAVPEFRQAFELARDAGIDTLAIDALHMLAIADAAGAEAWTRQGLSLAEASNDPRARRWRGALHNNLGWTLHDRGNAPAALDQFGLALAAYTETGTPEQVHIAWWAFARCLRSLGRHRDALEIQKRLAGDDPADEFVQQELVELRRALDAGKP